MRKFFRSNGSGRWLLAVCAVVLALCSVQVASAQQEPAAGPAAVTADDGGAWELGVHGSAGDLTAATAAERAGMWNKLNGWFVLNYSYAEASAWERDFKRASLGGTEQNYIDSVDLQFYVGHGAPARFTFATTNRDDSTLQAPGDCNTTWGDGDNEWLALTSCQVLADAGIGPMAQCMNRQHLILGFVTNASAYNTASNTQAYHFGRYLRNGYTVTQAWFAACDVAQRNRIARVIAEEIACFNDNPYDGSVCADEVDNDYFWLTHNCGTESASYVPLEQVTEMPVFQFAPYSLDEANQDFRNLGAVFGVPVTTTLNANGILEGPGTPPPPSADGFLVSTDGTLEVDGNSGIYRYTNLDGMWTNQNVTQALAMRSTGMMALTADDARTVADAFLTSNNLMGDGSVFYEVITDTTGTLPRSSKVAAAAVSEAETPSLYQVIYSRKLTVPSVVASGVQEDVTYTVVGPGAKQKVYVPVTAPGSVLASGTLAGVAPLGVQGGWRELQPSINAASGEQLMTTVLDATVAENLYLALDDKVTMNSIPIDISSREVLSGTLAYWEASAGSAQGQLIPVFEFTVRFTEANTGDIFQDFAYVPVNPMYMRPYAKILNPPLAIVAGQQVTLEAADATQTLKSLGVGDPFDFVLGFNGAEGTYTYEWYLDSIAPENKITDENLSDGLRRITFTPPAQSDDRIEKLSVILMVTDTDSPNTSVGMDVVTTLQQLFLPAVNR